MRSKRARENWIKAGILITVLTVAISAVLMRLKGNIFLLFPGIGISGNLTVAYLLFLDKNSKISDFSRSKYQVPPILICILVLSILDSLFIIGIRLSETVESAIFWNALQILFTSFILVLLLAFSLSRPRPLFNRATHTAILLLFSLTAIFLFTMYMINITNGTYGHDVPKNNGIFYELQLSQAGFGSTYPVVKAFFTIITSLTSIFFTIQFLRIKNKSLKKYYSVMYYSVMGVILFEIGIVTILTYFLKIASITFFGVASFVFSFVLAYYIIHFRGAITEIRKLVPRKEVGNGKIIIYPEKDTNGARKAFANLLKDGYSGLVFSANPEEELHPLMEKYGKRIVCIRHTSEGYELGDSLFESIEDIEALETFPGNFKGIAIYSRTLDAVMEYPDEKRKELVKYYRFLFKSIMRGAVLITPMKKEFLTDRNLTETDNPLWLIKPLMILRLEEAINTLHSEMKPPEKKSFLEILSDLTKKGLPSPAIKSGRISLDLNADMDRNLFAYLISSIGKNLEDREIMSAEKYRSLMKRLFDLYGDDYDAIALILGGNVYFIGGRNPRERVMKITASLSKSRGRALIISRVNPRILKRKYELPENTLFRWITDLSGSENAILPHLETIKRDLLAYIEDLGGRVAVLDGAEYLLRLHGFEALMEFLWIIQDRISLSKAVLLIPLNPRIFERKEIEVLRREFTFLE